MPPVYRKVFLEVTEEELAKMTREEVVLNLTDKERRFCENYVRNNNIKISAIKAGYSKKSAHCSGWKVRQKPHVNMYIGWLKLRIGNECHVTAMDLVDLHMRIAFADITDFIEVKNNKIKLIDGDEIDGQLVSSVKQGKEGVSVTLNDRHSSLKWLENYFDVMPKDWKQKIEERKLELLEQKLELEKQKAGIGIEVTEDDGFLEALKQTATEVWDEEE